MKVDSDASEQNRVAVRSGMMSCKERDRSTLDWLHYCGNPEIWSTSDGNMTAVVQCEWGSGKAGR